ncbi:hypothetical protein [Oceaniferula spumae]
MKLILPSIVLSVCLIGFSNTAYAKKQKPSSPDQKEESSKVSKRQAQKEKAKNANENKGNKKSKAEEKAKKQEANEKARVAEKAAAHKKALNEQKKRALEERNKAAEALRAAEKKVAAVETEFDKLAAAEKRQRENDEKQKIRLAESQEKAVIENMKKDIKELHQEVAKLQKMLAAANKSTAQTKR